MIGIKKFNEDILNETLRRNCYSWLSDSQIARFNKTATTCFQNLKVYLMKNDQNFNANQVMCFVVLDVLSILSLNFI